MPPKIQIKRTKTNLYPEKYTKEKHLMVDIKRKNKPDISLHRGVGKNKVTGEKSVTRMTTKIDRDSGKMAQNMVVNRKDASGNKTKIYKTGATQFGGTYSKSGYKDAYKEDKKTNRKAIRKETAFKKAAMEGAKVGTLKGVMDSGKVVKRIKQDSKPIMRKAIKEGPVTPIGKTVKRIEMGSKPIMEKRVKEGPVRRIKG
jgi:hypothetical protein